MQSNHDSPLPDGMWFYYPLFLVYLVHSLFRTFYKVGEEYPPPHFFYVCAVFKGRNSALNALWMTPYPLLFKRPSPFIPFSIGKENDFISLAPFTSDVWVQSFKSQENPGTFYKNLTQSIMNSISRIRGTMGEAITSHITALTTSFLLYTFPTIPSSTPSKPGWWHLSCIHLPGWYHPYPFSAMSMEHALAR